MDPLRYRNLRVLLVREELFILAGRHRGLRRFPRHLEFRAHGT
jgi:hypothetical protein